MILQKIIIFSPNHFPRYNTKFSGDNEKLRGIFHVVSRYTLHFALYRVNLDSFWTQRTCNELYDMKVMLFALHLPNLQTRILYTFVQLCSVIELGHRKKFLVKNSWDYWGYVSTVRVCYVMQIKTAHIFQIKKICNFRSPFFYAVKEM